MSKDHEVLKTKNPMNSHELQRMLMTCNELIWIPINKFTRITNHWRTRTSKNSCELLLMSMNWHESVWIPINKFQVVTHY